MVRVPLEVVSVGHPAEVEPSLTMVPCLRATETDLSAVEPGQVTAAGGLLLAAYHEMEATRQEQVHEHL